VAAIQLQARLAEGDPSVLQPPVAQPPTFLVLAHEWLARYPALHAVHPGTMDAYRSFTVHHLIPALGDLPITALTAERIEEFIEAKRAPGGSRRQPGKALADSSLRTGLIPLRLILQRAVRLKWIVANPMLDVDWRGQPRTDTVDPFTTAELRAILTTARTSACDCGPMLRTWAQSGMRAGEVAGLQWKDIDLNASIVIVRRTWSRQRLGPTKTDQERRVSVLHPVAEQTSDWRPQAHLDPFQHLSTRSLDPEAFVFGRGRIPRSSMEVHREWKRVLTAAGVRYRSPEQLRHTFASALLSRNAPLLYVQQQGGWRSAAVLLRVYARWMPQEHPTATPAQPGPPHALPSLLTTAP
jgi:integrase